MFFGEYTHQLDAKNRIRIPAKFKTELGNDYVFHKGANGTIEVFPTSAMEKLMAKYQVDIADTELMEAFIEFTSTFSNAQEDNQGRVVLPEGLKDHAEIDKDIVTIGAVDHLVIMSVERREAKRKARSYEDSLKILSEAAKKNGI